MQPSSAEDGFLLGRIIIFANGELPDLTKARFLLRPDDRVICADGGTRHAQALGIRPDLIIGDLDSAENALVQKFNRDGVNIEIYPRDKNETDLELAINQAIEMKPAEIVIVAALGGRLDQTLANISLLTNIRLAPLRRDSGQALDVRLDDGVEEILLCRDRAEVHGRSGDLVSLIPWQGAVAGIQTTGLKWTLQRETLYPDRTRGISNEMTGETAAVSIASGQLLVVHRRM
jgi:thiamine pyrophosphokinase